jgi:hypothetical protein
MSADDHWQVIENRRGDLHIIPENDSIDHETTSDCECRPWRDEDGIWVHNAADGRKIGEVS